MEHAAIHLADDNLFDKMVHDGLPEGCDLTMVTKDSGTEGGRPVVCLSFTVQLPDKSLRRAQCVVTGRIFAIMAGAFRGRYGDDGDMVRTADRVN